MKRGKNNEKTIKIICAGAIVCVLAFGCTACATLAERQKAEGVIRRAEEAKETRQEQYRDLGDSISDVTPPALLCLTIPTEPQAQVVPEVDAQVYDRIV